KALEKDARFRYQFAAEMRTDLQRLRREIGTDVLSFGRTQARGRLGEGWSRRRKVLVSVGCTAALIVRGIFIIQPGRGNTPPDLENAEKQTVERAEFYKDVAKRALEKDAVPAKPEPRGAATEKREPVDSVVAPGDGNQENNGPQRRVVDLSRAYNA